MPRPAHCHARDTRYEVADKGGMFVEVMPSGIIAFRYRYWLHGRKEKVTIGSYPEKSLKDARRIHDSHRSLVEAGQSPAREKQAEKHAILSAESFEDFAESWLKDNGHGERGQATSDI